ncbi:sensor histidine kinase [Arthrobacter sp. Br18]|uniref:sensor histidine kinase n=1 Tax=Arthrobacter sp. Br18 TaxID=1312954 RepID=UPI00047C5CB2|nr:sensor histidine kinase [Arthrobacter sp. Br18]
MKRWSLARQFFAGQLAFVVLLTTCISWVLYLDAERNTFDAAAERMLSVAGTIALDPLVLDAVTRPGAAAELQPYAVAIMDELGIDVVTIMAPDRTRFTHRNPEQIGLPYIGSTAEALAGNPQIETHTGTLGPSLRAIAPVEDLSGTVVAMVPAGITVDRAEIARNAQLPLVGLIALGALGFGALSSLVLSRHLRRATLGLGTDELARMFVFYDSVLHSVREGLLLTDPQGRLILYNDQAARLLGLDGNRSGQPASAADLELPASIAELLTSGRQAFDEVHLTDSGVLVLNQEPAVPPAETAPGGKKADTGKNVDKDRSPTGSLGTVTTIRDHTEIESLAGELQTVRTLTEALRAQTHEHANRLHTIVSLIELDRRAEALEFATKDLQQSQQLTDQVVAAVDEPFVAALLVGKAAQANERGIELSIEVEEASGDAGIDAGDLVTIVGNLLDNAFDAAAASDGRRVRLSISGTEGHPRGLCLVVEDSGPGVPDGDRDRAFALGYSTKDHSGRGRGIGLALVRQAVQRHGGTLEVATSALGGALFAVVLPSRTETLPAGGTL